MDVCAMSKLEKNWCCVAVEATREDQKVKGKRC